MMKPELLAPAGDLEKLKTAVDFGADAVYLAGERFGLRTASKNFTEEDFEEGVAYAHDRGVAVHVTLNAMPHENEFEGLEEYVLRLEKLGVDALIISDPGVFDQCPYRQFLGQARGEADRPRKRTLVGGDPNGAREL